MSSKTRKLNNKAKIITILFSAFIICIAAGLVVLANVFSNKEYEQISVSAGSIIYDEYDSPMEVTENSYIVKTWNGTYKLRTEDSSGSSIGENTILVSDNTITVIGGGYRVLEDGSVTQLSDYYETNIDGIQFFKLADRKYLLIAPEIIDTNEEIKTSKYAYIIIDKHGNAQIMNDDLFTKTLIPTTLNGNNISFDIANELLTYDTIEIDMKDVIGTTNEYDPLLYVDANSDYDKDDFVNPETIDIEVKGGDGGTGGTGGVGGTGGQGGVGGTGGTGGKGSNAEQADIVKSIYLLGVEKTTTTLNVKYSATDPFAQAGLIYIAIYDESIKISGQDTTTLQTNLKKYINYDSIDANEPAYFFGVNTYNTNYLVSGLTPSTTYQVVIGHITTADETWYVDDIIKTKTDSVTNDITVVSQTADKVRLNIKLDKYYNSYSYGQVEFYYNFPEYNGTSCSLGTSLLTDGAISFNVASATLNSGLTIDIPYVSDIAKVSEYIQAKIKIAENSASISDGITINSSFTNAYYNGTICNTTYTITIEDGFGGTIDTYSYSSGTTLTFPAAIDPATQFSNTKYNNGWGLTFLGWKYSVKGKEYLTGTTPYTAGYSSSDLKVTANATITAVWGLQYANTSLGDHQATVNSGYIFNGTDVIKVGSITFKDGEGNTIATKTYVPSSTPITLYDPADYNSAYSDINSSFRGWAIKETYDVDGTIYAKDADGNYPTYTLDTAVDITLIAKWKVTVNFALSNGTIKKTYTNYNKYDTITLPGKSEISITNTSFTGWTIGTSSTVYAENYVYTLDGNVTFKGKY